MTIDSKTFVKWKDQPILHDEDEWNGKYNTFGDMWIGERYTIETGLNFADPIWTEQHIREYAKTCGNTSAADLLLLIPPDRFDGDYIGLYNELKRGSDNGKTEKRPV